jgi:hypothetical protein
MDVRFPCSTRGARLETSRPSSVGDGGAGRPAEERKTDWRSYDVVTAANRRMDLPRPNSEDYSELKRGLSSRGRRPRCRNMRRRSTICALPEVTIYWDSVNHIVSTITGGIKPADRCWVARR